MADRSIAARRGAGGKWRPGSKPSDGLIVPSGREDIFLTRLKEAITKKDWDAIVMKAVEQAKNGDRFARKWLSDLAIGPPAQVHEHLSVQQQEVTINVIYDEKPAVEAGAGEEEGYEVIDGVAEPVPGGWD